MPRAVGGAVRVFLCREHDSKIGGRARRRTILRACQQVELTRFLRLCCSRCGEYEKHDHSKSRCIGPFLTKDMQDKSAFCF